MLENIENLCRLCLSREGIMLPIFRNHAATNETAFRSKIKSCASIEIFADDNLPLKVCHICFHQVEKFFQFQTMWRNSDAVLRSLLKEASTGAKVNLKNNNSETKNLPIEKQFYSENDKTAVSTILHAQLNEYFYEFKQNFDVSTCFVCSEVFLNYDTLMGHLMKCHSDIDSYNCLSCKSSFSNINKYKKHINLWHNLACKHCDCIFRYSKSLQEHTKIHVTGSHECKYCKKLFNDFKEMKKHEMIHFKKSCKFCLKQFGSKQEYFNHCKECLQKYVCQFCEKKFDVKKDLIMHVNGYHDTGLLSCTNCQKSFERLEEMQEHKCIDYRNDEFKCKNCDEILTDEISLMNHMSSNHSDDMLTCKFCAKTFKLKSSLRRHERSHSAVKPYQCKFCPRKFKDNSACIVHTRTHTGERPFQCQECNRNFKQLANLKMHTFRHHKKSLVSGENRPLSQENQNYDHLLSEEIIDDYADDNMREFQNLNESVQSTFNQSMHLL